MSSGLHSDHNVIIDFFSEEIEFELEYTESIIRWLLDAYQQEQKTVAALNYIFCSDVYLHQINMQYLNHDTLTDIITFSNAREGAPIEGDIFISVDRVKENAANFGVSFEKEMLRVIIHGSLHLMSYKDKTEEDQKLMTQKENFYIARFAKKEEPYN
ncbi:MAG: putative rRNA maturation factor [Polaribacter sp.]|jgi:probable rRNA maturation factor